MRKTTAAALQPGPKPTALPAILQLAACAVLLLAVVSCQAGGSASRITLHEGGSWEARLYLPADALPGSRSELLESLQADGIEPAVGALQGQDWLSLSGDGGMEQVRRLVFGQLGSLAYQPGARVVVSGAVEAGEVLPVTLQANPSTGYAWELAGYDASVLTPDGWTFTGAGSQSGEGTPQAQEFVFTARQAGITRLDFLYRRSWEPVPEGPQLEISAARLAQAASLGLPGLPPAFTPASAPAGPAPLAVGALPARWDWREQTTLPPVRNQGSCGSCWAFATVGALETNIAIHNHLIVDLSEQYLVSCNNSGWSCAAGGGTAHGYHYNLFRQPPETQPGAVLEGEYPYTGRDDPCDGPNPHAYLIKNWQYVTYSSADASLIKQAIYEYGPVKASVCAGSVFMNYHNGIYATDEKSTCGGSTNHAIVLTGWDDTQGTGGIWYLRNSWGAGWGEGGYMRIARGVSNVGLWTSYVDYGADFFQFFPLLQR